MPLGVEYRGESHRPKAGLWYAGHRPVGLPAPQPDLAQSVLDLRNGNNTVSFYFIFEITVTFFQGLPLDLFRNITRSCTARSDYFGDTSGLGRRLHITEEMTAAVIRSKATPRRPAASQL